MEVDSLQASYDNACELVETDINKAIEALRQIIMLGLFDFSLHLIVRT